MTRKCGATNNPLALEGTHIPADHVPSRIRLSTIDEVRKEMAAVYREARHGLIPISDGAKLTYMLNVLVGVIRDGELEVRITALEAQNSNR